MCMRAAKNLLDKTLVFDFLAPLALRLYLIPIFFVAGYEKISHIGSTIAWFGNPDWGLGLPFPTFMAYTASITELLGACLLLIGLGVRWISIPLMLVMLVAMFSVHWENGWLAIAHQTSEAGKELSGLMQWLETSFPGRYKELTEHGNPVMLNNGIEFAATYFIMLLVLFFNGAGKYLSIDYWVARKLGRI